MNSTLFWSNFPCQLNKCHTWPFIDFNISSLFILIYFLLYLSTFSNFKFSCHHFAAMARMLSLFSNCRYKFPVFFSISAIKFLRFHDSLLIVDTFIKSIPYCLDVIYGICQICCLGSSAYFLSNSCIPSFFILNSEFWHYVASIPCPIFVSIIPPFIFLSLHSVFCNYVASLPIPCLTRGALKEKGGKVSRDQKRREYGFQNN